MELIPEKTSKSKKDIKNSGIGLTNVKKRLELGYSAKDYELTTKETNQLYIVELKIKV